MNADERPRRKVARNQEQAIASLLTESTLTAAATQCGVGESTLRRWLKDPEFNAAYRSARRNVVDTVIAGLQQTGAEAVASLRRNLNCSQPGTEARAPG